VKRKGRPGGYRTAHFRNCRFVTGSIAELRRGREDCAFFAASHQTVRHAAQLLNILIDKILSTIEREN
jgi:hypothetical protein